MFGMSFGSSAPQNNQRETLASNQEIIDVLSEFGFVHSVDEVSAEDLSAIGARSKDIQKTSPGTPLESIMALAYVDRMVFVQKGLGNTQAVQSIISNIDTDFVATLVKPEYSKDEEFLSTVLTTGLNNYASGIYTTVSDALLDAVEKREHDLTTTPTPHGMIDGQDNVVQPTDTTVQ